MQNILQKITESAEYLQSKGFTGATLGIVLGTGLGAFLEVMDIEQSVPYETIPHFPLATVEFHKGQLLIGKVGNTRIIAMQGRFHYYEGYSMQEITFPVRVMKALGIEQLLLSNAAGGMNPGFKKGDLVLLDDHINLLPENPLRGLNAPAFGNRFVDMSAPYSSSLNQKLLATAAKSGIELKKGIYVSVMGPNLETRAEYRYLRAAGADMVGMSTVPEVIVANHIGLDCAAVSVITDECDPDHLQAVSIEEILKTAQEADGRLSRLFAEMISMQD